MPLRYELSKKGRTALETGLLVLVAAAPVVWLAVTLGGRAADSGDRRRLPLVDRPPHQAREGGTLQKVASRQYAFCCPPCVDEFVRRAKEQPDTIKPPEGYVKK